MFEVVGTPIDSSAAGIGQCNPTYRKRRLAA
jgi:hypothetical protein